MFYLDFRTINEPSDKPAAIWLPSGWNARDRIFCSKSTLAKRVLSERLHNLFWKKIKHISLFWPQRPYMVYNCGKNNEQKKIGKYRMLWSSLPVANMAFLGWTARAQSSPSACPCNECYTLRITRLVDKSLYFAEKHAKDAGTNASRFQTSLAIR